MLHGYRDISDEMKGAWIGCFLIIRSITISPVVAEVWVFPEIYSEKNKTIFHFFRGTLIPFDERDVALIIRI